MAYNYFRHPSYSSASQVDTFAITADSTSNTAVWTLTLTISNGDTETVTYTEDGSPTVAEIATGLYSAWNSSTKPHIAQITATNPSSGVVALTADTAGVPFSVALTNSDDGTSSKTSTTANANPSDYGLAQNWSLEAIPTSSDDVVFDTGSVDVLYTLNQSAVSIGSFTVAKGCSSVFGRFDNGKPIYLRIAPTSLRYEGNGSLAMFDIGSANISPVITSYGTPASTGRYAAYIKGSNIATLTVNKGKVSVASLPNETTTVATLIVGYVSTLASDAEVTVGSGVTLTTLNQAGGTATIGCAATTLTNAAGSTLYTTGTGAVTTVNAYGTAYLSSSGTITTLNAYGTVDLTKDRTARTITTTNLYAGATVKYGSHITFTNKPAMAGPGSATLTYVG